MGRDRYVVALSADHGVATLPEQLRPEGQDAGRIANEEVRDVAERAIAEALGPRALRPESTWASPTTPISTCGPACSSASGPLPVRWSA